MYILMYGKRPIAAYKSSNAAKAGLDALKRVIPQSYPVKPSLAKVPVQG